MAIEHNTDAKTEASPTSDIPTTEQSVDIGAEAKHPTSWKNDWAGMSKWTRVDAHTWGKRASSPLGVLSLSVLLIVALLGYGLGTVIGGPGSSDSASHQSSGMNMGGNTTTASTNVPNATQTTGNQPAKFVLDPDGAKHFTLTAQQVMWEVVKGVRVLADTFDGTVPGPMIHATAGDHIRITIANHLPEATAVHWHGLEVPTDNDGVPPVGMKPIQPGQSYTYDFTLHDEDAGTHWYHSHYNDLEQDGRGFYGLFLVDPRPGSPQAATAIHADVDYTAFIGTLGGYYVIDGKAYPNTDPLLVKHGQTVHIRLIGADVSQEHPMHLHGHTFTVVAEDGHTLTQPFQKDTLQVAPGETYDITFYAWAQAGSIYPFHCHILTHLMNPGQTGDQMGGLIVLVEYQK